VKFSAALFVAAVSLIDCGRNGNRWLERRRSHPTTIGTVASEARDRQSSTPSRCLPPSFKELVAAADPSVVQVRIHQERPSRSGKRKLAREGLGSAFVYDSSGLLLTNHHVIVEASEIRVLFKDGRELPAEVVGTDPPTDVAILRVSDRSLPALPLGDSDSIQVGDWVLAIGNPFGLSHTVSAGILSAKGRTIRDLEGLDDSSGYFDFLQTDASINPGNSGGPLIDLNGRVVGISAAIRARSNKIGFAIPINMVKLLIPSLVLDGRIRRSALGVKVDSILEQDVRRLGLAKTVGAIIRSVQPQGSAAKAGLRVDDIVVEFEGQPIAGPEPLRWLASMAGVAKHVTVKVERSGSYVDIGAILGELPPNADPMLDEIEDEAE